MPKIVLDPATFKVLASDTRLDILRTLDERPRTVSELARDLRLNKATVFEHLQVLVQAELLEKVEREGSKWVYYRLNWKGKNLLHPENTTIFVLLGVAALGLGGAVVQAGRMLQWWLASEGAPGPMDDAAGGLEEKAPADGAGSSAPADSPASEDASPTMAQDENALRTGDPAAGGEASDGGGFLDAFMDPQSWILGLLALALLVGAVAAWLVWQRARRLHAVEASARRARIQAREPPADAGPDPPGAGAAHAA